MEQQGASAAVEPGEAGEARKTDSAGSRRSPRQRRPRPAQSGDRGDKRRPTGDLVALLSAALDRPTIIVEDGKRRRGTKRQQIASQLVDRSAQADLRATKLLVDLMEKVKAGGAEGDALDEADEKVITTFLARLGIAE